VTTLYLSFLLLGSGTQVICYLSTYWSPGYSVPNLCQPVSSEAMSKVVWNSVCASSSLTDTVSCVTSHVVKASYWWWNVINCTMQKFIPKRNASKLVKISTDDELMSKVKVFTFSSDTVHLKTHKNTSLCCKRYTDVITSDRNVFQWLTKTIILPLCLCHLNLLIYLYMSVHYACICVNLCGAKVLFSWTMHSAGLWLATWAFQSLSVINSVSSFSLTCDYFDKACFVKPVSHIHFILYLCLCWYYKCTFYYILI